MTEISNKCKGCIMKQNRIRQIDIGIDMFCEMQAKIEQIIGCFVERKYTCDQNLPNKLREYIDELASNRGDKAELKKRVKELEKENELLRGLMKK